MTLRHRQRARAAARASEPRALLVVDHPHINVDGEADFCWSWETAAARENRGAGGQSAFPCERVLEIGGAVKVHRPQVSHRPLKPRPGTDG